jgi:hypothetical protein
MWLQQETELAWYPPSCKQSINPAAAKKQQILS